MELLKKLNNRATKDNILRIVKNMISYKQKISKTPYLKTNIAIGMELLYSFLYVCIKNNNLSQIKDFLKEISRYSIEDLRYNTGMIIHIYDDKNIMRVINDEIIKNNIHDHENVMPVNDFVVARLLYNLMQNRNERVNHKQEKEKENLKKEILENLKKEEKTIVENEILSVISLIERTVENPSVIIDIASKGKIKGKIESIRTNVVSENLVLIGLKFFYACLYSCARTSSLYSNGNNKDLIEAICDYDVENLIKNFEQIIKAYDKEGFLKLIREEIFKNELEKSVKKM